MTNGDRIREMASTNEGLAKLINDHAICTNCNVPCTGKECGKAALEWLDQEYLKPCPFCGDKNAQEYKEDNLTWLECPKCGGRTKMCRTLEEAETLWNRRAGNAD